MIGFHRNVVLQRMLKGANKVTETNGTHIAGDQTEPPSDVLRQQEAEYLDALEREVASLRRSEFSIHSSDEARQLVREVESMLSQCDGDGCAAWELLRDARAWAKTWKAKAKHNRKGWKMEMWKPWHRRRAWLELWESGR